MKAPARFLCVVPVSFLLFGCGGPPTMMREAGEQMELTTKDKAHYEAELIAVQLQDSALLCAVSDLLPDRNGTAKRTGIALVKVSAIEALTVTGFRNGEWPFGVVFGEVLPALGLAAAAASVDADAGDVLGLTIIPAVLSAILFSTSGIHDPTYDSAPTGEELGEFRKYARFAVALSPEQVRQLLRSYHQEALVIMR